MARNLESSSLQERTGEKEQSQRPSRPGWVMMLMPTQARDPLSPDGCIVLSGEFHHPLACEQIRAIRAPTFRMRRPVAGVLVVACAIRSYKVMPSMMAFVPEKWRCRRLDAHLAGTVWLSRAGT